MSGEIKRKLLPLYRKQREILLEYEKILKFEDIDKNALMMEQIISCQSAIRIERKCWLENSQENFMELVVLPGQRKEGLKEIKDFTKGIEKLIVIDPYIFSGSNEDVDKISEDFCKNSSIGGRDLKEIHFISHISER